MRARGPVILVVLAAALIGLLAVAVLSNLERVERVVTTPPRGPARSNPLLAADRFLDRMGVVATSRDRLDRLPPVDHALILAAEQRGLTKARADRLLDWVEQGGYLIVGPYLRSGAPTSETRNDALLDALGVRVVGIGAGGEARRQTYGMQVFGDGRSYDVEFFSDFGLMIETGQEPFGVNMVWNDFGAGRYVVLNDLRFLRNHRIGKVDHAAFLKELIAFGGERREAWLVYDLADESGWLALLLHAPSALIAVVVVLIAWLWRNGFRFGPTIPAALPGSRVLLEHVDALGHFLWRRGRADALLAGARQACMQRVARRRPGFHSLDRAEQAHALAAESGLGRAAIESALFGNLPRKRADFLRTMRDLERMRRES